MQQELQCAYDTQGSAPISPPQPPVHPSGRPGSAPGQHDGKHDAEHGCVVNEATEDGGDQAHPYLKKQGDEGGKAGDFFSFVIKN